METSLVAYDEIALKSQRVRRRLEDLLARNIRETLKKKGFPKCWVLRRFGRLYVEGVSAEAAIFIARVFGVVSVMPALKAHSNLESVVKLAVEMASSRIQEEQSFAIRPRVVGEHKFSSQDIAIEVGSAVLETLSDKGVHVDLSNPDVTIYIEIRDMDAFVYTQIVKGVGGLPYGSQGRLVSLFSGGIDSPVATWLMMKRGVEVLPLLMDQRPYVGDSYIERAKRACSAIADYAPSREFWLSVAPMGDVMDRLMKASVHGLRCVLCKRSMYRIAGASAVELGARGIITGESLGQVASQTLDNIYVLNEGVDIPVLRPLIGLDKVEITDIARYIGTYDITAKKVEGCKVVPAKPATRARIERVLDLERELELVELCSEAAGGITKMKIEPAHITRFA